MGKKYTSNFTLPGQNGDNNSHSESKKSPDNENTGEGTIATKTLPGDTSNSGQPDTPVAIPVDTGNSGSDSQPPSGLGSPSGLEDKKNINYDVPGEVPVLEQPSDYTCWATVATMMISWRDRGKNCAGPPYSIIEVMDKAGPKWLEKFKKDQSLSTSEKMPFLTSLRFSGEFSPVNHTLEGLLSLLKSHGPLWVTVRGDPNQKFSTHARIITGMHGDGSGERTELVINDPSGPPGYASHHYRISFNQFMEEYERVEKDNIDALQIVWNT